MAGRNDSKANRLLGIALVGVVVAMVGAAYAAVPLYQLFCQVTGYGGTPQIAEAAPVAVGERVITVRFNADVDPALPWARSDEHTSELQSLMRISYAVFGLKKQTNYTSH